MKFLLVKLPLMLFIKLHCYEFISPISLMPFFFLFLIITLIICLGSLSYIACIHLILCWTNKSLDNDCCKDLDLSGLAGDGQKDRMGGGCVCEDRREIVGKCLSVQ